MAHAHRHPHDGGPSHRDEPAAAKRRGRRLLIALSLNLGIVVAEVAGGVVSGSLALLADAAHNLADAGAILVAYLAWRISRRAADTRRTFGYARAETVGAVINLTVLLVIGVFLGYEAITRLFDPPAIQGEIMLIVGVVAMLEDIAAAWVLRKETGANVRSAFLHMIADALATLGVILGALAVMIWGVRWVDPAITAAIALYIFVHAGSEMRETVAVLMDSAPEGFDYDGLRRLLEDQDGVAGVHHLHLWRMDETRVALEVHLALDHADLAAATRMKEALKARLAERFGVAHATIEVECARGVDHDPALFRTE
ncbi:cation diffusion facilitator family transporter [Salinarimonas rosea]|uniref:cation diffusion facilitator family transporter n=1 Tax=Salinarimonas rosea TaxID=552063 RepID=UPI000421F6F5|nr:cation diffusion facilitator family transporter [Salinarimonas rosea]